jgi:hypothetical protein
VLKEGWFRRANEWAFKGISCAVKLATGLVVSICDSCIGMFPSLLEDILLRFILSKKYLVSVDSFIYIARNIELTTGESKKPKTDTIIKGETVNNLQNNIETSESLSSHNVF